MGTGRLFWQAAGRSVEDGEVWCRFQQDGQGGGDHGGGDHGGGDHGDDVHGSHCGGGGHSGGNGNFY